MEKRTCAEEDCEVAEGPEIVWVYGWHDGGCGMWWIRDRRRMTKDWGIRVYEQQQLNAELTLRHWTNFIT